MFSIDDIETSELKGKTSGLYLSFDVVKITLRSVTNKLEITTESRLFGSHKLFAI